MMAISRRNIELSKVNLSTGLTNVQALIRLFCEHKEAKQGEMFRFFESFQENRRTEELFCVYMCVCVRMCGAKCAVS